MNAPREFIRINVHLKNVLARLRVSPLIRNDSNRQLRAIRRADEIGLIASFGWLLFVITGRQHNAAGAFQGHNSAPAEASSAIEEKRLRAMISSFL
jgi:hypothetical protein